MLPLEPTQIFVFQPCLIFLLLLVGDPPEIIKGLRNLMKKPFILKTALPREKKKKKTPEQDSKHRGRKSHNMVCSLLFLCLYPRNMMSSGRVQPLREEESTKRAEKGRIPALCPKQCGSGHPEVFRWPARPQRLHYHGGNPTAFPDRETHRATQEPGVFWSFRASHPHSQASSEGTLTLTGGEGRSRTTANPILTNRTPQELT